MASQSEEDAVQRRELLNEALSILTSLQAAHPDSPYAQALPRNIELVQRDLAALPNCPVLRDR